MEIQSLTRFHPGQNNERVQQAFFLENLELESSDNGLELLLEEFLFLMAQRAA